MAASWCPAHTNNSVNLAGKPRQFGRTTSELRQWPLLEIGNDLLKKGIHGNISIFRRKTNQR